MKTFFLTIFVASCITSVFGQTDFEEKVLEEQAESSEQSELLEIIQSLRENPIDLNEAKSKDLEIIPGLSPKLISEIIAYRQKQGPFKSVDELIKVTGMAEEIVNNIRELVKVTRFETVGLPTVRLNLRTRYSDRIDRPVGFKNGTYESGPQKLYNRLKFTLFEKIAGGALLEKDSGETRFDDLRLFYIAIKLKENFNLLVGNYHIEAGQGLVLWGPYGFSKSSNPIYPIKKRARGVRGYLTVDENAAFYGSAATLGYGKLKIFGFVSRNNLDATPISNDEVSSLFESGFHRTETEINKKDLIKESITGGRITFESFRNFNVGATFYISSFDKIIADPDLIRNRYKFRGKNNSIIGIDWDWSTNQVDLFGEIARSKNGAMALLLGSMFDFDSVQMAFLHRNYHKDFQNFHGFGFGESNGTTQNERGYYTGIRYKITKSTVINAYYDFFSQPWRTFFEPLPVAGNDFLSEVEQKFGRQIKLSFRFRKKTKQQSENFKDELGRDIKEFVKKNKWQFRLQFDLTPSPQFRLRSRVEFVQTRLNPFNQERPEIKERGFLVYQDIRVRLTHKLQMSGRITLFDTDSFDSRVFQYENDLPGVLTNRALFGRGSRRYLLIKFGPIRSLALHLKYSETFRDDVNLIGTGPDQIQGNLDRRFGVQFEMKF